MNLDLGRIVAAQAEGKALGAHPALMDRSTPVSVYSPGASRQDAVISQRNAGHHLQAYGGNEAIDWVYDCIGLYMDAATTAPYVLSKKDGTKLVETKTKGTPPDYEVGPVDLYRLLKHPNPFMLYSELVSLLVIDLMMVGNAYWLQWQVPESGRPLALYRLAPSHVKIVPGQFGPKRYEYQPPGARTPMKIDPSELIHFRRPNPHDAYYGMGVIQGAGRAMDLEIAITDTTAAYYENRADPSMIIQAERRIPRDVFNKLRAQLRARVSGSKRAGELLVLENGLTASTLDRKAAENLFDVLGTMSQDRVYAKFRASRKLFGYTDTAGTDKVTDLRREFDNYALRPFLGGIAQAITAGLTDAWGVDFAINHQNTLDPDSAQKIGGALAAVPGIKVREIRRLFQQFGIEESTGDPEIDEMVLNLPTPEADENGQITLPDGTKVQSLEVGADRNLPGEAGRPPKGSNTRAIGVAGKALTVDQIESWIDGLIIENKALNTSGERVTIGNVLPGEKRPDDPFGGARKVDLDVVTVTMAAELRSAARELERGLLDVVEGKALKTSDIVKRMQQSPAWATFKERVTKILESGARDAAVSGVMHTNKTPDEDVDYDGIVQTIVHRPDGLRSIIRTAKQRIANKIREVRDADGERADYNAAIQSAISDWSATQVVTIADSEATEAYNEAVLTTLEMVGENQVFVTDGDEDDQPCIEANGQVWTIDEARTRRKEHPRCRRAFLSLTDGSVA